MSSEEPQIREMEAVPVATLRETVRMEDLPGFFDRAYHAVMAALTRQGVLPVGPPVGIYFGMPSETVDVAAGFPVAAPIEPEGDVGVTMLPAGRVVEVTHRGSYDEMGRTYQRLTEWMQAQDVTPRGVMWETYETEPDLADPSNMRTLITWPITGADTATQAAMTNATMTNAATTDTPQIREIESTTVAALRETIAMADLPQFFDHAYHTVVEALNRQAVAPTGPALGIYFGMPSESVDVAAGFPIAASIVPDGDVREILLPAGRAAETVHRGSYGELAQSYQRLQDWIRAEGVTPGGMVWESYETMPSPEADPASMRTRITWLIAD